MIKSTRRNTEIEELLLRIRKEIDRIKYNKLLVLVEGKRDRESLRALEITRVYELNKPLYAVVEEISNTSNDVVILTDLDDEGKRLYHTLARDFQRHGVNIDNTLRTLLSQSPVRHIEGLAGYMSRRYGP